ncbi:MAG: NADH:flavin oxidoreductase, partial [bacterium]
MMRDEYNLFSEGMLSHLVIKNRLVRSANYEASMTKDGMVTEDMLNIYRNLAIGGVGMIITGYMAVMLEGKTTTKQTCIYDDIYINEIAK